MYTLKSAISKQTLRARRPWCYSILDKTGARVGTLRKNRRGWMLSIKCRTFVPSPEGLAAMAGIKKAPVKGFSTVASAREFLRNPIFA